MAPHLSAKELDDIQKMSYAGKTPQQIQEKIGQYRARFADAPAAPHISQIHRVLAGKSHNRGGVEMRGRPKALKPAQITRIMTARSTLQKKYKTKKEIPARKLLSTARLSQQCS